MYIQGGFNKITLLNYSKQGALLQLIIYDSGKKYYSYLFICECTDEYCSFTATREPGEERGAGSNTGRESSPSRVRKMRQGK
jgi:hypothetical protein